MALGPERIRSIVESILLVSGEPVTTARLAEVIAAEDPDTRPEVVREAIDGLLEQYRDPDRPLGRGVRVEEVGGGLQLRTTPDNGVYVRRYLAARPQRLTKPALETLAIIAYRQPVTKPDIEAIRGVDTGAVLKALLDRELIKIVGKKEELGRPMLYATTPKFLELFGLRSLSALPTLREFHELDESSQEVVDELVGAEPKISDLARTAEFLMEKAHDPDLDQLEAAERDAESAGKATRAALGEGPDPATAEASPTTEPGEGPTDAIEAAPAAEPPPEAPPEPGEAPAKRRRKKKKEPEPTVTGEGA